MNIQIIWSLGYEGTQCTKHVHNKREGHHTPKIKCKSSKGSTRSYPRLENHKLSSLLHI